MGRRLTEVKRIWEFIQFLFQKDPFFEQFKVIIYTNSIYLYKDDKLFLIFYFSPKEDKISYSYWSANKREHLTFLIHNGLEKFIEQRVIYITEWAVSRI